MSRIIKFRAWDGNKMHEGVQPLFDSETPTEVMVPESGILFVEPRGNKRFWYEIKVQGIMQYTGLKDKNGKDIYEGDIVEYEGWHGGVEHAAMEQDLKNKGLRPPNYNERRVILGHPYGHYIMRKLNDTTDMTYSGDTFTHSQDVSGLYWEVIGNTYQNPELLSINNP